MESLALLTKTFAVCVSGVWHRQTILVHPSILWRRPTTHAGTSGSWIPIKTWLGCPSVLRILKPWLWLEFFSPLLVTIDLEPHRCSFTSKLIEQVLTWDRKIYLFRRASSCRINDTEAERGIALCKGLVQQSNMWVAEKLGWSNGWCLFHILIIYLGE